MSRFPIEVEVSKTGTKRRRKKKSAWDQLSPKQQVLATELLVGNSPTSSAAVTKVLGEEDKEKAKRKAYDFINTPKVQMALQERINFMYPNLSEGLAKKIKLILEQPVKFEKDAPGISVQEFIKVAEYLAKVQGWIAPSRSLNLKADVSGFKWPGQDK